jgi:hypothetical protein
MEKRPLRFSLHEAFFEGSRSRGREDCLSTRPSYGNKTEMKRTSCGENIQNAEFRSAEKNVSGTALRT